MVDASDMNEDASTISALSAQSDALAEISVETKQTTQAGQTANRRGCCDSERHFKSGSNAVRGQCLRVLSQTVTSTEHLGNKRSNARKRSETQPISRTWAAR